MNRKLSTALVLALILALTTSVAVFAQGNGPSAAGNQALQQGQPVAPQDGSGYRHGQTGEPGMARQATGTPNGSAANFLDVDGDGQCDHFVDADGDGVCDSCDQSGSGQMARRSARSQDGTANDAMRRGGGSQGRGPARNR